MKQTPELDLAIDHSTSFYRMTGEGLSYPSILYRSIFLRKRCAESIRKVTTVCDMLEVCAANALEKQEGRTPVDARPFCAF